MTYRVKPNYIRANTKYACMQTQSHKQPSSHGGRLLESGNSKSHLSFDENSASPHPRQTCLHERMYESCEIRGNVEVIILQEQQRQPFFTISSKSSPPDIYSITMKILLRLAKTSFICTTLGCFSCFMMDISFLICCPMFWC